MNRFSLFLVLFLFLFPFASFAAGSGSPQDGKTVTCVVTDKSGAMPGASVFVKGTSIGGIADNDGKVVLKNLSSDAVLVVSFVGYDTVEVPVGSQSVVKVLLRDSLQLEEIVVVGYGTQKKANLTGAVDQVGAETFEGRPNANLAQMLQGQIPNLNLKFTDGRPNSSPSFNIRGKTSIGQGGSALVLIDGVEGNPSLLNPNDIESVSVLKDAASSAIYGSRAPYGVVLITTKSSKDGKATVSYQSNFSFETPTAIQDVVSDGYTWASHFYDAYRNYNFSNPSGINKTMQFSTAWLEEYKRRAEAGDYETLVSDGSWGTTKGRWVYFHKGTDYIKEIYKDYTFAQTHNVSVSGSDDKFSYYLSGRFYDNDGLFNTTVNPDSYRTANGRIKVGYQVTPWLKVTNNTDIAWSRYVMPQTYSEGNGNIWRNIADEGHPCSPIWNPDGTMSYSAVYSVGDYLYGRSNRTYINRQTNSTVSAVATFFDNKLRVNADFTYRNRDYNTTVKKVKTDYSKSEGVVETIAGTQSYMSETIRKYEYIANNEYVEYENTFGGKHWFKALAGYNYEQQAYKETYAYNDELLTPDVENINLALGTENRSITGNYTKWRSVGVFARLNYGYDDRYLLEVNGRYDGSSKFPPRQRWAFFPSVSAGWRLTQEPWFNISKDAISNIKLRASYGSLGNSNVSVYAYEGNFSMSTGRIFNGTKVRYTSAPSPIPASLTWETAQTVDAGLDMSFLRGRLSFTGDYYVRKTKDMYTVGPELPDVFGASSPKGNYASMTTNGYEISLTWSDQFVLAGKPFNYSVRGTLADYYSTIDEYNNPNGSLSTTNTNSNYYKGMRLGEIWGFVSNGLWQTQEEIDAAEAAAVAAGQKFYNPLMQTSKTYKLYPGDIKFEDLNGNGYIDRGDNTVDNPGDRKVIGNSEPRYIYSFGIDLDWNNIFFNVFFQGVGKQDWYPASESSFFWGQYNRPYAQMPSWHLGNYWTPENTDAYLPRYAGYYSPFYKGSNNANTRYLQKVSYIRLKTLQIGYNLPEAWTKKINMKKVGIFFSGENLWTWSPLYKHTRDIDVTANIYGNDGTLSTTGDGYNYPTMRSFSIGLNLTF